MNVKIGPYTFPTKGGQVALTELQAVMGEAAYEKLRVWLDGQTIGPLGVYLCDLRRYLGAPARAGSSRL